MHAKTPTAAHTAGVPSMHAELSKHAAHRGWTPGYPAYASQKKTARSFAAIDAGGTFGPFEPHGSEALTLIESDFGTAARAF